MPRTAQSIIDEWNERNTFGEIEHPRQAGTLSTTTDDDEGEGMDEETDDAEDDTTNGDSFEMDFENEDEEEEDLFINVSGFYRITSKLVSEEWPDKADDLTIRLHMDCNEDGWEAQIWGRFKFGVWEEYMMRATFER
jgi:hypothetical protein